MRPKAAIVTGASRGIGAAIARRLAHDGIGVVVNYHADQAAAQAVVAAITASGGTATAFAADVARGEAVEALFDFAQARFGGIDILVNNAGTLIAAPLAEVNDADFAAQVSTNFEGAFRCLREAARRLSEGGRIVNLSSSTVATVPEGLGVYTATKAALEAMSRVLARELGPRGITVNAVAPGAVETALFQSERTPAQAQAIRSQIPLGRLGTPDDIARVVAFLVGVDRGWVNGQVLRANGGRA